MGESARPRWRTTNWTAVGLAVSLAIPARASAADFVPNPRQADVPLAVEHEHPMPEPGPAPEPTPAELGAGVLATPGPADAGLPADAIGGAADTGQARIPTKIETDAEVVRVAVGLGPSAPGSKAEKSLVDELERAARASHRPRAEVRRLRAGAGEPRRICRERQDDLVLQIDYIPDRAEPALVPYDCTLGRALGIRSAAAAAEPSLVGVLWDEHDELVRDGVRARRAGLAINPKVRTGLIAGGAIVVLGAAVGLILYSTLRSEAVVITVGP